MVQNKKGSLTDMFIICGVVLIFFVGLLTSFKISTEFNNQIQSSDIFPSESKDAGNDMVDLYSGTVDNSFLFLVIGLGIGTLILASMIAVHPIFMIPGIFVYLMLIFFSAITSNIYHEMATAEGFTTLANQLTFISTILTYFPWVIGFFGALLMIVMYNKYQMSI